MKRIIILMLCIFLLSVSAFAENGDSVNWYCIRNKTHSQPKLDGTLSVIDGHRAFFCDTAHGDGNAEKVLYLTFDAGYENGNVAKILDILKDEQVPAAFFILGHMASGETELVGRMQREGHLVCNHTASHKNMSGVGCFEDFAEELQRLETLVYDNTGIGCAKYYRPPEGCFTEENLEYAERLGYTTVFWSIAYADWDNASQPDYDFAKDKLLSNTHNGAVILLHPTSSTNAAILRDVIREWKAQGYTFGSLEDIKCAE